MKLLSGYLPGALLCSALGFSALHAQEANPTATQKWPQPEASQQTMRSGEVPVYRVQVVGRDIPAINYFHRSGSTKIGFEGTPLLPEAKGSAEVKSNRGQISISARFEGLRPANSFGVEYLTYVLWAITPEGRPQPLGEVLPDGSKNNIEVTTNLQSFALIVTAEPYFAVSMPSDVVVVQNKVLNDRTQGIIEQVNAHTTLLPRGAYSQMAGKDAVMNPITRNEKSPLELYEAINAIQIAKATGADKYAADTFQTAVQGLQNAQAMDAKKSERKQEITYARAAVQSAEDARIIAIRKRKAEDDARNQHEREAAEQSAQQAQLQAQQSQLQAQQAQLAAQQAAAQKAEADARAAQAQLEAQQAQQQQKQAVDQTEQMREQLKSQLNEVLSTRESARGLIINMSDVLFDTGKYTLKSEAREKLAKVSGILLAHPDLKLQVEGYTDNIGGQEYNQKLSEQRAQAVGDYLVSQSVPQGNITASGFGMGDPVADNGSAQGRSQNRRVQLVVSGASIGVQQQQASPSNQ